MAEAKPALLMVPCPCCNVLFLSDQCKQGLPASYCTPGCKNEKAKLAATPRVPRVCGACGVGYKGTPASVRCSPCRKAGKRLVQRSRKATCKATCKACGKECHAGSKTGMCKPCMLDQRKRKEVACSGCGLMFVPKRAACATFHSRECAFKAKSESAAARKEREENERKKAMVERSCDVCGKVFDSWHKMEKRCSDECREERNRRCSMAVHYAKQDAKPPVYKACRMCGVRYEVQKRRGMSVGGSAYCGKACGRKAHRKSNQLKRRLAWKARCAAVKAGDRIDPASVFARDEWRCWICGVPVKAEAEAPDPLSPTIDHVVPFAKGGKHVLGNVRCAHFICNSHKCAGDAGDVADRCRAIVAGLLG